MKLNSNMQFVEVTFALIHGDGKHLFATIKNTSAITIVMLFAVIVKAYMCLYVGMCETFRVYPPPPSPQLFLR